MPGRDGTGPSGQGSRTGRGMGNCSPGNTGVAQAGNIPTNRPYGLGGRMWDATVGRLFGRGRTGRGNRINRR